MTLPNSIKEMCILKDIEICTTASEYFNDNYKEILEKAKIIASKEAKGQNILYQDVVNDVYVSIRKAEEQGNGYDEARGFTVEEYIYGTIKKYMKNSKYRVLGGHVKGSKNVCVSAYASEELENIYKNAEDVNNKYIYEVLENTLSIEEEIKTCLRGGYAHNIKLDRLLEYPEEFMCEDSTLKKVFKVLTGKLEPEILESLRVVLEYENRNVVKDLVCKVKLGMAV